MKERRGFRFLQHPQDPISFPNESSGMSSRARPRGAPGLEFFETWDPNSASRGAAQDYSPRCKPWARGKIDRAPKERKKRDHKLLNRTINPYVCL